MRPGEIHYAARGWVLAGLFAGLAWARHASDRELRPEALVLVALGAAYRLWAARHIAAHSNGTNLSAGPLAASGPYAWGRHPLYLSNIVIALGLLGFANCLPLWAAAAFLGLVIGHHVLLAAAEEDFLASRLGEGYRRYREVTPAWLGLPRTGGPGEAMRNRAVLHGAWARQAANLAKTSACVVLLWVLA